MNSPSTARSQLAAFAIVAAPGVVAVVALVAFGVVNWLYGLLAIVFVLVVLGVILRRHFLRIEALRHDVEALGRNEPDAVAALAHATTPLLSPGIESAVAEAARRQLADRKQLETVVAGNEAILNGLPDPLVMLDRSRRIVRANPAAARLFGDNLAGRDLTEVLRGPALLEAVDEVLAGRSGRSVEFSVPGRLDLFFRANVTPLPNPGPDGTVAILSLHDMTGVRRAEQLRADFVANASHELRPPLASLLGFIETLSGPARDDEEARGRFLGIMHEQAWRMTRLIEDLLSLSRIEMQEHNSPTGRAELDHILRSVAEGLELKAREKDMTIAVECPEAAVLLGDRDELAQVFQNLMDNAVKYGHGGTAITVTAAPCTAASKRLGRDALAISVSDRSDGIAREHLARLTERFYRVDAARSRQLGGTGLGLAIVKHIVSRHRGTLEIDSTPGEGSTFTVYLPVAGSGSRGVAAE